jgi:2-oxoglutarate dehydrogenase E2 component (dihydrolipoamide succinyltransferase)|tara:strand:+ start:740 stop:2059 length:1320 start_codon:yes stop_codon:yes gene_type:complete
MGKYHLKLPKMGESVAEATLTKWLKEVGDSIDIDEAVVEIATDKVDSDVPSELSGVLIEKKFSENDVVQVGEVFAVIQTESEGDGEDDAVETPEETTEIEEQIEQEKENIPLHETEVISESIVAAKTAIAPIITDESSRFYSPLVKNIASQEGISLEELEKIKGTGQGERVTKYDMISYLKSRGQKTNPVVQQKGTPAVNKMGGQDQVIEMSRMAKLTAAHMINSKQTSAHVQSFVETDVTALWNWREKVKNAFFERENEKLTFTPLFITALIKALKDFPLLNSSVQGDTILQKRAINIGLATSMADGNLIVPVIKNADHLNLVGLAKAVNDLATRARNQALRPEEIQDGTFTFTNIGNFGALTGTPIINQPQVGIIAMGVIRKMPAVIETPKGDFIGIRKKVIISHSFDHRIINGAMGGQFVKNMADYLENWDESLTL